MPFFFFSVKTESIPFALMGQAAEEAEKRRSAQSVGRSVVTENVWGYYPASAGAHVLGFATSSRFNTLHRVPAG